MESVEGAGDSPLPCTHDGLVRIKEDYYCVSCKTRVTNSALQGYSRYLHDKQIRDTKYRELSMALNESSEAYKMMVQALMLVDRKRRLKNFLQAWHNANGRVLNAMSDMFRADDQLHQDILHIRNETDRL